MPKLAVIENPDVFQSPATAQDGYGIADDLRPSVVYFRRDLRQAITRERAVEVGLVVCGELEQLKAWVEERGLIPPRWMVSPDDPRSKEAEVRHA